MSASQDDVPPVFRLDSVHGIKLFEIPIEELQHHFREGRLTSLEYTDVCLDRIRRVRTVLPTRAASHETSV